MLSKYLTQVTWHLTLIFKKLYELSRVLSTDLNLSKALNRCQSEIISIIFDWADLGDLQRPSGGKNRRFTMTSSRSSSSKNRLHLSERRGDDIPQICGKRKVRGGGRSPWHRKNSTEKWRGHNERDALRYGNYARYQQESEGGETAAERADLSARNTQKCIFFQRKKKGSAVTMECKWCTHVACCAGKKMSFIGEAGADWLPQQMYRHLVVICVKRFL